MTKIINQLDYTFSPNEQAEILKAASYQEVDAVYTQKGDAENQFHFYADEDFEDYLFSIDTDADGSCVIWDKR